jgi:hypothetical protein
MLLKCVPVEIVQVPAGHKKIATTMDQCSSGEYNPGSGHRNGTQQCIQKAPKPSPLLNQSCDASSIGQEFKFTTAHHKKLRGIEI